ncbi:hypothetical protein GOP47_0005665 [Adiantum capillus-veneris]|uniref:Uncharacterized protein n=1 Tax=Adiantum capillus-veneris TaxID=13818 RepID=A0A9D4ZNR6_ADICA|nr:hypothetical protein GOP47_0005665 [Adiantum capillus-veneris]
MNAANIATALACNRALPAFGNSLQHAALFVSTFSCVPSFASIPPFLKLHECDEVPCSGLSADRKCNIGTYTVSLSIYDTKQFHRLPQNSEREEAKNGLSKNR